MGSKANRKICLSIFLSLTIASLSLPSPQFTKAESIIIRVPSDYPTIQEAIDAAPLASVILVGSGVYSEYLTINKTLDLVGADKTNTIIMGNGSGTGIWIESDNVLVSGFTIQNYLTAIEIYLSSNSIVRGNIVAASEFWGIDIIRSNYSTISDNIMIDNGGFHDLIPSAGLLIESSSNSTISGNVIIGSIRSGIIIGAGENNMITGNTISCSASVGLGLCSSGRSTIFQNNFISNPYQIDGNASIHTWDDGARGNYWDDYTGLDDGSNGRVAGDGIGDTNLPHHGADNHPLVRPLQPIPVVWKSSAYSVAFDGNSTVSSFLFNQTEKKISFAVTGLAGTMGYCNVTIPTSLLRGEPWKVMLNNTIILSHVAVSENQTHTFIHFTYDHNPYTVQIIGTWVIPEIQTHMMLAVVLAFVSIVVFLRKRRSRNAANHRWKAQLISSA